jgi:predicted flavoprotein YhiN
MPALVPLITSGNVAGRLEGLNLKNVLVSVWKNEKKITERFGEMIFMQYGISGPIILSLSRGSLVKFLKTVKDLYFQLILSRL